MRGQPRALKARVRDKRGDHLCEGDEIKSPRGLNGNDYGSATPANPATLVSVAPLLLSRRVGG